MSTLAVKSIIPFIQAIYLPAFTSKEMFSPVLKFLNRGTMTYLRLPSINKTKNDVSYSFYTIIYIIIFTMIHRFEEASGIGLSVMELRVPTRSSFNVRSYEPVEMHDTC